MDAIPLILIAGLGVLVFYPLRTAERHWAGAIQTIATRYGMYYLGDALPRSLTLEGTPFQRLALRVWNVIDGEPFGTRVMAFDYQVGEGKRSWRRNVIAVEDTGLSRLTQRPDLTIDRSGQWQILYRPKGGFGLSATGLTPVDELEATLKAVLANSAKSARSGLS